jgi:subtilisin family serine protease
MRASTFSAAAAVLLTVAPTHAPAAPAGRFATVPQSAAAAPDGFRPAFAPLGISTAPTTVVLQLRGDPVAVASANALVPMTRAEKAQHRDRLRAQQAPVESAVRARGGTVLASYQHAYNGVKVRIAADRVKELAALPGVVAVRRLQLFRPVNVHGVPLIGAPVVWGGHPAFHGEGVKVAIIDTGIDYTHADFGGPGTSAAYDAAHANETAPANPALFGPAAPKVKGGTDLVGDSYDPDPAAGSAYQPVPHPDPNPLDCNGHGSHVAGTAAGFGVLATGATFTGPWDATTVSANAWTIGPGVAPKADLYAVRVFGCAGPTDVVVDAIDWAVEHEMDVINMSLGSDFGSADDPSAVAASNAAKAGVIVVASAGNGGSAPYITGSPATGTGAISVAASDPTKSFPGANIALTSGTTQIGTIQAIDANGAPFADGTSLTVVVLKDSTGNISLGCNPAEYTAAGVTGKLVVTRRGTCARVARAIFGQQAGAAAVVMLNNAAGYPPYEGPITENPDTGEKFTVTIPFLGVPLTAANRAALLAADGATLSNTTIANPGYLALASFSSGGPRTGDSALKPEVTAPGVSISSVGMGTGNGAAILSGTSMAAPHTTGAAALVRQAHPDWKQTRYWKAALVQTADPSLVAGYSTRNAGGGLVQVQSAAATQVVALVQGSDPVLNFGFAELDRDLHSHRAIVLRNFGSTPATFDVAQALAAGSKHSLVPSPQRVTVPAGGEVDVGVDFAVPAATAGDSSVFADVSGVVAFTPVGGGNGGVSLHVPYYLVPQAVSDVATRVDVKQLLQTGSATATVTNARGVIPGDADWYAWGLSDKSDNKLGSNDLRAAGVQTFPPTVLAFAVSTYHRWSNAATNEFDVFVDVNGDGAWDYDVVGIDLGLVTTGSFSGQVAVAVFTPDGSGTIRYLADAPTDSSTLVLPVAFSQLCKTGHPCMTAGTPISYQVQSFGLTDGTSDAIPGTATFDPFHPMISTGMFDVVSPDGTATEAVSIDRARFAQVPALGFMIVTHDNPSDQEAQLIGVQ